jgi:hypothetical protein
MAQWSAAASYASSVKGVKQVVNNLQIAESMGTTQRQAAPSASPTSAAGPAQRAPIALGTPTPDVIHKKLNAFVYAAKRQTADQQQYDEMDCYNWGKSQGLFCLRRRARV